MKKLLIIPFFLLVSSTCFADTVTGQIEGIKLSSTGQFLTIDSIQYEIIDNTMIPFILDSYRTGLSVLVDYNGTNQIIEISTDQLSGYPMQDLSAMVSFMIGGFACMAFIGAIRLKLGVD